VFHCHWLAHNLWWWLLKRVFYPVVSTASCQLLPEQCGQLGSETIVKALHLYHLENIRARTRVRCPSHSSTAAIVDTLILLHSVAMCRYCSTVGTSCTLMMFVSMYELRDCLHDTGVWHRADGTSASAPIMAAIASLLNDWYLTNFNKYVSCLSVIPCLFGTY